MGQPCIAPRRVADAPSGRRTCTICRRRGRTARPQPTPSAHVADHARAATITQSKRAVVPASSYPVTCPRWPTTRRDTPPALRRAPADPAAFNKRPAKRRPSTRAARVLRIAPRTGPSNGSRAHFSRQANREARRRERKGAIHRVGMDRGLRRQDACPRAGGPASFPQVEHGHVASQAGEHVRRGGSHDPSPDHRYARLSRRHARTPCPYAKVRPRSLPTGAQPTRRRAPHGRSRRSPARCPRPIRPGA